MTNSRGTMPKILLAAGIILLLLPTIITNFTKTTVTETVVHSVMILAPGSSVEYRFTSPSENAELILQASSNSSQNVIYSILVVDEYGVEYANEIVAGSGQWRILLGDPGVYRIILYYPATAPADLGALVYGVLSYETPRANTPEAYAWAGLSIIGALLAGYAAALISGSRRSEATSTGQG